MFQREMVIYDRAESGNAGNTEVYGMKFTSSNMLAWFDVDKKEWEIRYDSRQGTVFARGKMHDYVKGSAGNYDRSYVCETKNNRGVAIMVHMVKDFEKKPPGEIIGHMRYMEI